MINIKFTAVPTTSVVALAAAVALVAGPAVTAQESEDREISARVLVVGADEAVVHRDAEGGDVSYLEIKKIAEEAARSGLVDSIRLRPSLHRLWAGGAFLGVEVLDLNESLRAHFGVPEGSGVLVSKVAEDSPAHRAGIQVGDILTRFDGEDVTSFRRLTSMVRGAEADDPANLEIWRDGKVETLSTTLDERPRLDLRAGTYAFSFRGREDLDGDGEIDVFSSPENVHEKIQEYFNGDEWKERHEHMQRFLHERRPDMKALEDRLATLKEQLEALERRLEEKGLAEEN